MLSEPLTLYKLMILHMLKQVKFPLSNSQMSDFFLTKEYTTYFTLQQALSELLESKLIKKESVRNSSRYQITREGEETLAFFGNQISDAIIEDIRQFLNENKVHLRDEVSLVADFYKSTNQDYTVHCEIREGTSSLISMDLSVPGKNQAEAMCLNWSSHSQEIYSFVMNTLMRDESDHKN